MPYTSEKIKIEGTKFDRRVKLTQKDRDKIRMLRVEGWGIRAIARAYPWVSRRLIQFVLFPERLATVNYAGHWKKYKPTKKHWAKTMREHRRYKQSLYTHGVICLEE